MNPQKLLGITKTSSLLLLAEPRNLQEAFGTGLPYMEPSWGGGHLGEAGLQGTRPGEILKLWLGLRQLGLEGIVSLVEAAVARREDLERRLRSIGGLVLCSGPLHLLAFRPEGSDGDAGGALEQRHPPGPAGGAADAVPTPLPGPAPSQGGAGEPAHHLRSSWNGWPR